MPSEPALKQLDALRLAAFIGRMVRKRRVELGWKQSELSERSGVNGPHISRIERGHALPLLIHVYALAKAMHCDITDLIPFVFLNKTEPNESE